MKTRILDIVIITLLTVNIFILYSNCKKEQNEKIEQTYTMGVMNGRINHSFEEVDKQWKVDSINLYK